MALEAERESALWRAALRPEGGREHARVFSALCEERFALGLETIYEGYLVHYGRPRLFSPPDAHTELLLGDYLYAHGLVRVSATGSVEVVADLAELISLCAQLRAEVDGADDGAAWAATAALLGQGRLEQARSALRLEGDSRQLLRLAEHKAGREAVEQAFAAHRGRVG